MEFVRSSTHTLDKFFSTKNFYFLRSGVRLGEWDTLQEIDCEEAGGDCAAAPVNIRIIEKIPHRQYDPNSKAQGNDIALLRLENSVQYTDYVKPICLPLSQTLRSGSLDGIALDVAGWGKTETGNLSIN